MSPQSILLVPSFPRMKSGNISMMIPLLSSFSSSWRKTSTLNFLWLQYSIVFAQPCPQSNFKDEKMHSGRGWLLQTFVWISSKKWHYQFMTITHTCFNEASRVKTCWPISLHHVNQGTWYKIWEQESIT